MEKVVLISGGTSGIGRAIVKLLLANGYHVSTFGSEQDDCEALKESVNSDDLLVTCENITDEDAMKSVVQETMTRFGKIDILINNAGIGYYVDADDVDIERLKKVLEVNILGMAILTKYAIPHMKNQKSGVVLNVISNAGYEPNAHRSGYTASKFGAAGFSKSIRLELESFGIKVITVNPCRVKTGFWDQQELDRRKELNNGELPAMIEPYDVARAVMFALDQPEGVNVEDISVTPFPKGDL